LCANVKRLNDYLFRAQPWRVSAIRFRFSFQDQRRRLGRSFHCHHPRHHCHHLHLRPHHVCLTWSLLPHLHRSRRGEFRSLRVRAAAKPVTAGFSDAWPRTVERFARRAPTPSSAPSVAHERSSWRRLQGGSKGQGGFEDGCCPYGGVASGRQRSSSAEQAAGVIRRASG